MAPFSQNYRIKILESAVQLIRMSRSKHFHRLAFGMHPVIHSRIESNLEASASSSIRFGAAHTVCCPCVRMSIVVVSLRCDLIVFFTSFLILSWFHFNILFRFGIRCSSLILPFFLILSAQQTNNIKCAGRIECTIFACMHFMDGRYICEPRNRRVCEYMWVRLIIKFINCINPT